MGKNIFLNYVYSMGMGMRCSNKQKLNNYKKELRCNERKFINYRCSFYIIKGAQGRTRKIDSQSFSSGLVAVL